jgi:hypothetical protein
LPSDDEEEEHYAMHSLPSRRAKAGPQPPLKYRKLCLDFDKMGEPEYEGILLKLGNDRRQKWRKRWFMLIGQTLYYAETEVGRHEPLGNIPLSIARLERTSQNVVLSSETSMTAERERAPIEAMTIQSSISDPSISSGGASMLSRNTPIQLEAVETNEKKVKLDLHFDLVISNNDLHRPFLRRYRLQAPDIASFRRWIDLICLRTQQDASQFE